MPMPASVVRQKLERELKNLSGRERVKLLREALEQLPGYTSGPYGKLRNWINAEIERTQTHSRVTHQDTFAVKREGHAQLALVGPPNSGKSSLLHALSGRAVQIGNYPFTTLKPVAATINLNGGLIQLVEIPGLIEGAAEGRGNGLAMLSALRVADACVYMVALQPHALHDLRLAVVEVQKADISLPHIIVGTRLDVPGSREVLGELREAFPNVPVLAVSCTTGAGLDALRDHIWSLSGLMRVYPAVDDADPFILPDGSTILDFAGAIHGELAEKVRTARIWGPSAKFPGQSAGVDHRLQDGDRVKLNI